LLDLPQPSTFSIHIHRIVQGLLALRKVRVVSPGYSHNVKEAIQRGNRNVEVPLYLVHRITTYISLDHLSFRVLVKVLNLFAA
jgi:hypothetical protein